MSALIAFTLVFTSTVPAFGYRMVTVPVGTIIPLRMDVYLSSDTSGVGDRFTATVFRSVEVDRRVRARFDEADRRVVIPTGSKVQGHVTGVSPAQRPAKAGTLAIAFDELTFPNGSSIAVDGTLTSLTDESRARLEDTTNEDEVEGGSQKRRAVVFIGGGAGAGAVIGAVAGGGKGAAVGAGVGAVLGTIGLILTKGEKAEVKPGAEFGMMVERSFTVNTDSFEPAGERFARDTRIEQQEQNRRGRDSMPSQSVLTSANAIRNAQMGLRDRGYYDGPVNGVLNEGTRSAIRRLQRDRNLTITGDLDPRTARELGIASEFGVEAVPVEISTARAERIGRDSISIYAEVITRGGGWEIFTSHFVTGTTLHVNVRGVPPRIASTAATSRDRIEKTIDNVGNVSQVVFHGSPRDITVDLTGNAGGPARGDAVMARQIQTLANRLLMEYQRDLNVRGMRNQVVFDSRRNFRQGEIELLYQLHSLAAIADLYNQMIGTTDDPDALKGAAASLVSQARLVNRILRRSQEEITLTAAARDRWDQLNTEIGRLGSTSDVADRDLDRIR